MFRGRYTKSKAFLALCIYGLLCRIQETEIFAAVSWCGVWQITSADDQLYKRAKLFLLFVFTDSYAASRKQKLLSLIPGVAWQITFANDHTGNRYSVADENQPVHYRSLNGSGHSQGMLFFTVWFVECKFCSLSWVCDSLPGCSVDSGWKQRLFKII